MQEEGKFEGMHLRNGGSSLLYDEKTRVTWVWIDFIKEEKNEGKKRTDEGRNKSFSQMDITDEEQSASERDTKVGCFPLDN